MFEALKYNLKHNRKSVMKNATAWFIFGAIILVFIFWGLNPRDRGVAHGGAAAVVNESTISQAQLLDAAEQLNRDPRFEQLRNLGGDAGRQLLQSQALGQLIELELIHQGTDKERIWTSDAEVRDIIVTIPAFQQEGRFRRELYQAYLDQSRKTPAELENEIRRQRSLSRAVKMFSVAMRPAQMETERAKVLQNTKANLEFASVPNETLVIAESLPEAEVKAYLAKPGVEAKVKDYFESHKQDFSTPERVKARHILIRAKAGEADAEKKALAKIEDLAKRAKSEDFGKLASEFSEDPGSKTKGGLLDFFSRGKMVPEFENAAFTLGANEISKPVKTEYGYHLIQVLEKKPAANRKLEDSREDIASRLLAQEKSREALDKLGESLKKGDQAAVQAFVAQHKLKWEETGPFSIDTDQIPKIGGNDEAIRAAFQLSSEKPLAANLVREGGRSFILRYKPVAAADKTAEKKADPQADMFAEMTAGRRGEDALRKWVDGLRKQAKISTNLGPSRGAPEAD